MIVFIDTNILFNNWHLNNANFQFLFNYLENTNSILAISELVCQEIDNKFYIELENLKKGFDSNLKKGNSLLNKEISFDNNSLETTYRLKDIVNLKTENVEFYDYSTISNSLLVDRALKKVKPFKDEDKGFRDSLIWLSFLSYIKKKGNHKIAFINNNSSDFLNSEKTDLSESLRNDLKLQGIKNEFKIYDSIRNFIEKEVGFKHTYTKSTILEEFIYPNERLIEKMLQEYINSQSVKWFDETIKSHTANFQNTDYITSFNFEIIEGIEDPELLNWEQIEKDKFFSQLSFHLRIVEIELVIPKVFFEGFKDEYKYRNIDIEYDSDNVILKFIKKVYLNISFNFDTSKTVVTDLDINLFGII